MQWLYNYGIWFTVIRVIHDLSVTHKGLKFDIPKKNRKDNYNYENGEGKKIVGHSKLKL